MKEIQIFNHKMFGAIRTTTNERGEPLFVGKDVAEALGYSNTRKALLDHVDNEDRKDGVTIRDAIGRDQKVVMITESGLYSLILSSKLPQARAFKRWVTAEVLPQIRKTGGYIPMKDKDGQELSAEQILERANAIVGRTLMMLNAPNNDCLTATQVAADWGMDVRSFNAVLQCLGIQYRRGGRWHLSLEYEGRGYAEDRHYFSYSLKGSPKRTTYLVWTPLGVKFLNSFVHTLPVMMQPKSIQLSIEF
jgi:prophage antirepressor-like protein